MLTEYRTCLQLEMHRSAQLNLMAVLLIVYLHVDDQ